MSRYRLTFVAVAAVVVILLGLIMLLNIPLPYVGRAGASGGTTLASVYALGTVYGLAGVCAGPLLGAVLTVAAVGGNAVYGGIILMVFAAGMTLPLLILALAWGRLPFVRKLVRPREIKIGRWRNTLTGIIGGTLTVAIGILLLTTNGTSTLNGLLGATQQARLEGWVSSTTTGIPDIAVLGAVVVVAAGVWLAARRAARRPVEAPESPPASSA